MAKYTKDQIMTTLSGLDLSKKATEWGVKFSELWSLANGRMVSYDAYTAVVRYMDWSVAVQKAYMERIGINEYMNLSQISKKLNASAAMKRAWEIARISASMFGGRARDYLSDSLRMAWAKI